MVGRCGWRLLVVLFAVLTACRPDDGSALPAPQAHSIVILQPTSGVFVDSPPVQSIPVTFALGVACGVRVTLGDHELASSFRGAGTHVHEVRSIPQGTHEIGVECTIDGVTKRASLELRVDRPNNYTCSAEAASAQEYATRIGIPSSVRASNFDADNNLCFTDFEKEILDHYKTALTVRGVPLTTIEDYMEHYHKGGIMLATSLEHTLEEERTLPSDPEDLGSIMLYMITDAGRMPGTWFDPSYSVPGETLPAWSINERIAGIQTPNWNVADPDWAENRESFLSRFLGLEACTVVATPQRMQSTMDLGFVSEFDENSPSRRVLRDYSYNWILPGEGVVESIALREQPVRVPHTEGQIGIVYYIHPDDELVFSPPDNMIIAGYVHVLPWIDTRDPLRPIAKEDFPFQEGSRVRPGDRIGSVNPLLGGFLIDYDLVVRGRGSDGRTYSFGPGAGPIGDEEAMILLDMFAMDHGGVPGNQRLPIIGHERDARIFRGYGECYP